MTSEQRAARLLRWYPPVWRERYGDEFTELLMADIDERPVDWRRTLDVAVGGSLARLSAVGLRSGGVQPAAFAMSTVAVAIAVFVAAGVSLWSQLRIAAANSVSTTAASSGTVLLTVGGGALVVLVALAVAPVIGSLGRAVRRDRGLLVPMAWVAVALTNLWVGAHHFATQRALVGGGASLGRAATLAISTYWVHPATWLSQPVSVQLWMIASPLCFLMLIVNASDVVRRVELSAGALRYEARLSAVAAAAMLPITAAVAWWVVGSQSAPGSPLQAGSLDVVLIGVMAAAAAATSMAGRRISS